MSILGVALVGCGGIAQLHLLLLQNMPETDIRAVCDVVPERAQKVAQITGATAYTDYHEAVARPAVLINQAIHTLDLLLWLGGTPKSVSGSVSTDITDILSGIIETEDSAHLAIDYENGRRAIFYATNAHAYDAPVEVELIFEQGTLLIRGDTIQHNDGVETILYAPQKSPVGAKAYWGISHGALLEDFYDCARDGHAF